MDRYAKYLGGKTDRTHDPACRSVSTPRCTKDLPVAGPADPARPAASWRSRDAIREREDIPGSRADELLEALDGLRASVDILGSPTFGILRLLTHWATHGGGVKVNEDELLAELRTVGADEWEQAVAEAERDLQETPGGEPEKGSS